MQVSEICLYSRSPASHVKGQLWEIPISVELTKETASQAEQPTGYQPLLDCVLGTVTECFFGLPSCNPRCAPLHLCRQEGWMGWQDQRV